MFRRLALLIALLLVTGVIGTLLAAPASAQTRTNLFFLHHSTGRNVIAEGDLRDWLAGYNAAHGTAYEFWDHDYNDIGLTGPDGSKPGISYQIPGDNTYPDGLHTLWTTANSARDRILDSHEVIAFKSCFPASDISSDAEIAQRQQWYLDMRDVFDAHPEKVFVVMSQPPLHRLVTNAADAARARAFATWLCSDTFTAGHPNVVAFDLFDLLAAPDDGSATANMLRWEYERSHYDADSHPDGAANAVIAPALGAALVLAAETTTAASTAVGDTFGGAAPSPLLRLGNHPNPFNPLTTVTFALENQARVRLAVYDLAGGLVATLADGEYGSGTHAVAWDGRADDGAAVPSGVYLARAASLGGVQTRRLTLVR